MLRKTLPVWLILFSVLTARSFAADFTNYGATPLRLLSGHLHSSSPNPDAPALKSFMAGNPAGTMLAAPAHYRIGVVRIEFQPDDNPRTTGNGTFGDIPFFTFRDFQVPGPDGEPKDTSEIIEDPSVDSRSKLYIQRNLMQVSQYYEKASHGNVIFEVPDSSDISSIIRLDVELAEYGNDDDYSLRTSQFAVDAIAAADAELDFSQYDVIMVFHAGCGQHTDFDEQSPDDLHPVSINHVLLREILADGDPNYQGIETNDTNTDGGKHYVKFIQIFPETAVQDWDAAGNGAGGLQGLLGVMVHELGHYFGLPDLYDTFEGTRPTVGFYALMATGFFNSVSRIPSNMSAWCRIFLGWDEPLLIDRDTDNIPLRAMELGYDPAAPRILKVPISSTEYYLIELRVRDENFNNKFDYNESGGNTFPDIMLDDYRLPDGSLAEFDWGLPRGIGNIPATIDSFATPEDSAQMGSGVLIWHIDEQVIREKFTRDLTLNYLNTEPEQLGIGLVEADGINHMRQAYPASLEPGFGSPFDMFGGAVPGYKSGELGNLNTEFGPFTSPNTLSFTGVASNIEISGFNSATVQPGQPVVDTLVTVSVNFNALTGGDQIGHLFGEWPKDVGLSQATPVVGDFNPEIPGLEVLQADDGQRLYSYTNEAIALSGNPFDNGDNIGSAALGDINNDGFLDAVRIHTGGWVSAVDRNVSSGTPVAMQKQLTGDAQYTPVVADVDGDGIKDILIVTESGENSSLHAINGLGSEISGYPVEFFSQVKAMPAVLENASGSVEAIYLVNNDGNLVSLAAGGSVNWTVELRDSAVCQPVIGRMGLPAEGESYRVNVFDASGNVYSILPDGSMADGWPVATRGMCLAGGALGDVDGDGLNELVVPVDYPDEENSSRNRLYVIEHNGASASGYPITIGATRYLEQQRYISQPALADIDGDGQLEILFSTAERLVLAYKGDGTRRPSARFITGGYSLAPPVPADINLDGKIELVVADGEGFVYAYETNGNALAGGWSGLGGNPGHTGFTGVSQSDPAQSSELETLPEKYCYLYPNPVRGGDVNLTYQLGGSDVNRVTVEVFTTSGERVANFDGSTDMGAGMTNQLTWSVDRYASGVYLVLVKAYSAGGTRQTIRKMAVIK